MYPPKTGHFKRLNTKKSTCICGIYGLPGLLACRALFLGSFRRLASGHLEGLGRATIQPFKAQLNTRNVHRMSQLVLVGKGYGNRMVY